MKEYTVCEAANGLFYVRPNYWAGLWKADGKIDSGCNFTGAFRFKEEAEEYAKWKNLQQKERLLELPFTIGKPLFDIVEFVEGYDGFTEVLEIDSSCVEITKDKEGVLFVMDGAEYRTEDFGVSIFDSESVAEDAIKRLNEVRDE